MFTEFPIDRTRRYTALGVSGDTCLLQVIFRRFSRLNGHVVFLYWFFTGLALIVIPGTQNLFVLNKGVTKDRIGETVLSVILFDAFLIILGVLLFSEISDFFNSSQEIIKSIANTYILGIAVFYLWLFFKPNNNLNSGNITGNPFFGSAINTLLNPYVIMENVFVLGYLAVDSNNPALTLLGIIASSILWFTALGYSSFYFSSVFLFL